VAGGTVELNTPAVFVDDSLYDPEAQAGAMLFGGEEGIKDALEMFLGDPAPGVLYRNTQTRVILGGGNEERTTAPVHGLDAVQEEVQEDLAQLLGIRLNGGCRVVATLDLYSPFEALVAQQFERFIKQPRDLSSLELGSGGLGEFKEPPYDVVNLIHFPRDDSLELLLAIWITALLRQVGRKCFETR
jgi:hypothetical protein